MASDTLMRCGSRHCDYEGPESKFDGGCPKCGFNGYYPVEGNRR